MYLWDCNFLYKGCGFQLVAACINFYLTLDFVQSDRAQKQCPNESTWVLTFDIPTEYSHGTKRGIETGQLTKASRCEIVHALYTRVLQYTPTPSPFVYSRVCQLLVARFPKLEDVNGTGYVSL